MNNIGGVIVTFFPDAGFESRLAAIAGEFSPLLVVDNSADAAVTNRLRACCAAHQAELVLNPENRGLGAALNQAFEQLAQRGLAWVAAFDQDSMPEAGFGTALHSLAQAHPECAVVGANWSDEGRPGFASRHLRAQRAVPFFFERVPANNDLIGVTCVITSGSLFRIDAWRALGGFDEALFLDYVDTDYCLRARARGHAVAVAVAAVLAHRRAAKQPMRMLGRTFWPAFMTPLRLRYQWRNRVQMAARHGWRAPHWLMFEFVYSAKIIFEILLLEDRKGPKLAACARGLWDGITGRKGKIVA
jgi:rhamnosyltransferase